MSIKRLLSIIFLLAFWCNLLVFAVPEKENITPPELYETVRSIIEKYYLDKTFNNQDLEIWSLDRRYKGKLNDFDDSTKAIQTMLTSLGD